MPPELLELRNPHAVLAALEARPEAVEQVTIGARPSNAWRAVAAAARDHGRPVVESTSSRRGSERGAGRGANAFALVAEREATPLGDLWTAVLSQELGSIPALATEEPEAIAARALELRTRAALETHAIETRLDAGPPPAANVRDGIVALARLTDLGSHWH